MPEIKKRTLSELQRLIERFETINDGTILPDLFLVLRLDGRRFGSGWQSAPEGEYPFGKSFITAFQETACDLMSCGHRVLFSFVHGDEISLLLDPMENTNPRRRAKLISIMTSAATVCFSNHYPLPLLFHAKLSELPTERHVVDYFMWQKKVALRNITFKTLAALMVKQGKNATQIDSELAKMVEEDRRALLAKLGRPMNTFSTYERGGSAFWWKDDKPELLTTSDILDDELRYESFVLERLKGRSYLFDSPATGSAGLQTGNH